MLPQRQMKWPATAPPPPPYLLEPFFPRRLKMSQPAATQWTFEEEHRLPLRPSWIFCRRTRKISQRVQRLLRSQQSAPTEIPISAISSPTQWRRLVRKELSLSKRARRSKMNSKSRRVCVSTVGSPRHISSPIQRRRRLNSRSLSSSSRKRRSRLSRISSPLLKPPHSFADHWS